MSVGPAGIAKVTEQVLAPQTLDPATRLQLLGGGGDVQITLPLSEPSAVEALLNLDQEAVFWSGRDGELQIGLGAAAAFALDGQARFTDLEERARTQLERIKQTALPGTPLRRARLYGGLAFQPGHSQRPPWELFGDGRFVLPRYVIERCATQWTLSVNITAQESAHADSLLQSALELRARIGRQRPAEVEGQLPHLEQLTLDNSEAEWIRLVEDILARIASGDCTKIVAALRSELSFAEPLNVAATLAALSSGGAATVFAFKRGTHTFCGASPERLLRKVGLDIASEALAGTFHRSQGNYATELLRSPKEHEEHLPVKRAILEALEPLCSELHYPAQPEICELPHLLHLKTPIAGRLKAPVHILRLIAGLHPTPAVGGVPRAVAASWIAEQEGAERGWYAGPVGYFDAAGDGDFFVALRSGVITDRCAFLYAGAGIVAGSEPHTEYAETQLKLRSLRASLRA
ncbi:MAG: hypothetical protein RJA70_190 [Pseudomonadota bacterium]|jgi:menaquinone-specific isochorismate synthase